MTITDIVYNVFANSTVPVADLESAGSGITGGYTGHSFAILVLIILFPALSMYNAIELLVLIFFTFNKYKGVYFWSLLIASLGVIPYSLGFLFKYEILSQGNAKWTGVVLLTIGWYTMVTGESVVLWSRLHLILDGERGLRILKWTKWMIIIDAIILHIPTSVLTFGSNGNIHTNAFAKGYSIMEKIQMSGFFVQEVILSAIYIIYTVRILKTSVRDHTKLLMWQLLGINVIIIIMDMGLLGLEAASLYLLETLVKGVIYSVKLKLEFAILGQLVKFVGRPGTNLLNDERTRKASVAYFGTNGGDPKASYDTLRTSEASGWGPGFVSDFAELSRLRTQTTHRPSTDQRSEKLSGDVAHARQRSRSDSVRLPPGMTMDDVNFAMFEHTEDTSLHDTAPAIEDVAPNGLPQIPEKSALTGDNAV